MFNKNPFKLGDLVQLKDLLTLVYFKKYDKETDTVSWDSWNTEHINAQNVFNLYEVITCRPNGALIVYCIVNTFYLSLNYKYFKPVSQPSE